MCFGDTKTSTTSTTSTPDPRVQAATTGNLDYVQNMINNGFTPYAGQQVANFSPQQQASFNQTNNVATDPQYLQRAQALVNQYSSNPAGNVQTQNLSSMIPQFMNQFTDQALQPQLRDNENQRDAAVRNSRAGATMAGAFGDPRAAIDEDLTNQRYDRNRQGIIGGAYKDAFNSALGAAAQQGASNVGVGTTNAGLTEQMLSRMLGGASATEGLQNQQLQVAGAQNTMGGQQTAQEQAKLNADKNQWLMSLLYPQQLAQLMNQTIATGTKGLPTNTNAVTTQPDNSGMGLLGSLGGSFLGGSGGEMLADGLMMMSDVRVKDDIAPIGKLNDGTNVYEFKYKGSDKPQIGVMAQEVEQVNPAAVREIGGIKHVDLNKVAARAHFARAFGIAA